MRSYRVSAICLSLSVVCIQPALGALYPPDLGAAAGYALLGLEGGTVSVNSATTVTGDFGYSAGVTSTINAKITWPGTAYVHSTATFAYSDKDYVPAGGIVTNSTQDARLNQANVDAIAAWNTISGLTPTQTLGAINDTSVSLGATNGVPNTNVVQIASLNMNSDVLSLTGDPGDFFLFNIMGDFMFADSQVQLSGVTADHILFNFPASGTQTRNVLINKSTTVFNGTILAPNLDGYAVEYHNPATFNGAIIAKNITVHSDFNLNNVPFVPVPGAVLLGLLGLGAAGLKLRKSG